MEMLKEELIPWAKETFGWDDETEEYEEEWTFQQDSAPKSYQKGMGQEPDEMVARVVDSWPGHLQACIDAEGGYIE
uniref:Phage protein n=1 Tax=Acrobeloides nanus TaxID=290746 RepID=A0A914CST1_9BILA